MRFAPPALGIKFAAITADSQVGFFKGKALQIPCKTLRVLGRKIRKQKKRKKKQLGCLFDFVGCGSCLIELSFAAWKA